MQVAIGARVMLRHNMCTSDGLVNGAMGTVVGFEWPEGQRIMGQQTCCTQLWCYDRHSCISCQDGRAKQPCPLFHNKFAILGIKSSILFSCETD